ncbi:hypothetical protein ACMFMG_004895 [Clarireedia jacksonii]
MPFPSKASIFFPPSPSSLLSLPFPLLPLLSTTIPLPSLTASTPPVPCVFTDTAASSASTHSFSSIPCAAPSSSWQINWGYNTDGDFAVMTVVNTVDSEDAFL